MGGLFSTLSAIEWQKNITDSFGDVATSAVMENAALRLAVWTKQFELADEGNPALCFSREMQIFSQQSAALIGLCLYKASAATTRAFFETALYYTYFRTHLDELTTLVRDERYYLSKADIIEFHKTHTTDFKSIQQAMGLLSKLDPWYMSISAIAHGQLPGSWNDQKGLDDVKFSKAIQMLAVKAFLDAEEIVHSLFLCTVGRRLWNGFAPDAKSFLLKGLSAKLRSDLGLDLR